jgi:hypothetical protein
MYLVAATFAIIAGIPATFFYGLTGAVTTILIASAIGFIAGLISIVKRPLNTAGLRQAA